MPPMPRRRQEAVRRQAVYSTQGRGHAAFDERRRRAPVYTAQRDAARAAHRAPQGEAQRALSPRRRLVGPPGGSGSPTRAVAASGGGGNRRARSPSRRTALAPSHSPGSSLPVPTSDGSAGGANRRARSPSRRPALVPFDAQPSTQLIVHQGDTDAHSYHSSDSEEEPQEANWIVRCQQRWHEQCRVARAYGISVRSKISELVPETVENRRRLASALTVAKAASQESVRQVDQDTLPSRWDSEYTEASALDRAMRSHHGLADDECEVLWKDGIETVAWLDQLRDEDFMEAGIDVAARREQAAAEERAQRAWESKVRAEQRADPVALVEKETVYHDHRHDGFSWHPIDDDEHFAKNGRKLDARRRALRERDDELLAARARGEEKALEARNRRAERDARKREVEEIVQRGARELELTRALRFGKLSQDAVGKICRSITTVEQLTSLDLSDIRQLGLDAVDRYLLDLIRLETIAGGATDPKGRQRRLEKSLAEKEAEVKQLESDNSDLRSHNKQLQQDIDQMQEQLKYFASVAELDSRDRATERSHSISVVSDAVGYDLSDAVGVRPTEHERETKQPTDSYERETKQPTDSYELDLRQASMEKVKAQFSIGRPKDLGYSSHGVDLADGPWRDSQPREMDAHRRSLRLDQMPEPEPEPCPECGADLGWDGGDCPNINCRSRSPQQPLAEAPWRDSQPREMDAHRQSLYLDQVSEPQQQPQQPHHLQHHPYYLERSQVQSLQQPQPQHYHRQYLHQPEVSQLPSLQQPPPEPEPEPEPALQLQAHLEMEPALPLEAAEESESSEESGDESSADDSPVLSASASAAVSSTARFYADNNLQKFVPAFEELGVADLEDFQYIDDSQLASHGMKPVMIRKLRRALQQDASSTSDTSSTGAETTAVANAPAAAVADQAQPTPAPAAVSPELVSAATQPETASPPARPVIKIACSGWEDTANLPPGAPRSSSSRHVRYVITVDKKGEQYTTRKRWQELMTLGSSLSKLDEHLATHERWRANGGKILQGKAFKHRFDQRELDKRKGEVDQFCFDITVWLNRLDQPANGNKNLLEKSTRDQSKNLIADFFDPGTTYDASRATIAFEGAYGMQQGVAALPGRPAAMQAIPEHQVHER